MILQLDGEGILECHMKKNCVSNTLLIDFELCNIRQEEEKAPDQTRRFLNAMFRELSC
jgi:hypothetical protein